MRSSAVSPPAVQDAEYVRPPNVFLLCFKSKSALRIHDISRFNFVILDRVLIYKLA